MWNTTAGTFDAAAAHFVAALGDSIGQVRYRQQRAHVEPGAVPGSSPLDAALQLAQDVEDARDVAGNPGDVPLRMIEIPEVSDPKRQAQQFISHYFSDAGDVVDVSGFLAGLLEDDPGPAPLDDELPDDSASSPSAVTLGASDETFTTPNGQPYIPRRIGEHIDVHVLRAGIEHGWTVAMVGEPGSGKTTLAQVAAPDLELLTFNGETSVEDIIGRYNPSATEPSGFAWSDGPLLTALRAGRPFLADELPRAPQEVQAVFLSVCDHRRSYSDPANPNVGTVTAQPGFAVLIAYNPGSGYGIVEALHDRVSFEVTVPTDLATAAQLGVPQPFVAAAKQLQRESLVAEARGDERGWIPTLRTLLKARDNAEVLGERFAAEALVSACPDELLRPSVAAALEKALRVDGGTLGSLVAAD